MTFVVRSVRCNGPVRPNRRPGTGVLVLEEAGHGSQRPLRAGLRMQVPRRSQRPPRPWLDLADGAPRRRSPVDQEQHRPVGQRPARHQVLGQRARGGPVLPAASPHGLSCFRSAPTLPSTPGA